MKQSSSDHHEVRRHVRYRTRSMKSLRVKLTCRGENGDVSHDAVVIDISQGGAKLELADTLPIKSKVALTIALQSLPGHTSEVAATVCWIRPARRAGRYWIGLAFAKKLATDVIVELALAGYLNRRQDVRHRHSIDVAVRWELIGRECEATITDYSVGGFCLECDEEAESGERLLLCTSRQGKCEEPIPVRVCWTGKTQESYLIGCAFANKTGFRAFRRRFVPEPQRLLQGTSWLAVTAGIVATALGAYYLVCPQ